MDAITLLLPHMKDQSEVVKSVQKGLLSLHWVLTKKRPVHAGNPLTVLTAAPGSRSHSAKSKQAERRKTTHRAVRNTRQVPCYHKFMELGAF